MSEELYRRRFRRRQIVVPLIVAASSCSLLASSFLILFSQQHWFAKFDPLIAGGIVLNVMTAFCVAGTLGA